jgi:hypothetical protein
MAANSGVVDTSVFKGVADLHAEVLSNDSVVAPAHEVVQDSDLIADSSMPVHADAAPEHSGDVAATSTENATAEDTGHVHAELAYADTDHAYADVDHAYADHGVADIDHAYADHAFADAAAPDSMFADHSILTADDGMPHSFGADAAKGQDDGNNAALWWWAGGAALAAGAIGYWAGDDNNDDASSTTTAASPDVHVVVESAGNAYIDTNGDGVHQDTETTLAEFGHGGSADLAANSVTVHFNGIPGDAIDLTGFGADDKIEFHMEAMAGNYVFNGHGQASYLTDMSISAKSGVGSWAALYPHVNSGYQASIDIHQTTGSPTADFNGNLLSHVYYMDIGNGTIGGATPHETAIAFWTDVGNALNDNALLFPTWNGTNTFTTNGVLASLNANNEGGVVDFIWPSTAIVG